MVNHVVLMTLFQHGLSLILSLTSLKFSTSILFNKGLFLEIIKFSPVISLYFVFLFFDGILASANYFYLVAFWRPDSNAYDARLLYWLGIFPFIFSFLGSVLETFLCIDRCCSIIFALQYTSQKRLYCTYATVVGFVASALFMLYFNSFLSLIPSTAETNCTMFACLLYKLPSKNLMTTKFILTGMSLIGGIILSLLVRCFLHKFCINNRGISNSVLIVIASTIFFEISPNIFSVIVLKLTGNFLTDYVGPYAVTFSAINITICAAIYSTACRKAFNYSPPKKYIVT